MLGPGTRKVRALPLGPSSSCLTLHLSTGMSGVSTYKRSRSPSGRCKILRYLNMSQQRVHGATARSKSMAHRFEKWMINEGSRQLFVAVFMAVHAMVFAFAMLHYTLHDELTAPRKQFGIT